jgi:predicted transcriptional regulator
MGISVRVFGELETVVMARLWALGDNGTVREVLEQIQQDREIAYTTVLSTMENLHRKGHLTREREGKAYRYRTALSHAEHTAGLMREALSRGGRDTEAVLTHFVGEMNDTELAGLREVIRRRAEGQGDADGSGASRR